MVGTNLSDVSVRDVEIFIRCTRPSPSQRTRVVVCSALSLRILVPEKEARFRERRVARAHASERKNPLRSPSLSLSLSYSRVCFIAN